MQLYRPIPTLAFPSMHMLPKAALVFMAATLTVGCAATPNGATTVTPADYSDAKTFYDAYATALRAHRRDTLARFYHPAGALIVLDGMRLSLTNAGIDSLYRGPNWEGPAFFAFDSLRFDAQGADRLLVTGGFRWREAMSSDTVRYIYLSLLERTPGGLKIRVEHETVRPR